MGRGVTVRATTIAIGALLICVPAHAKERAKERAGGVPDGPGARIEPGKPEPAKSSPPKYWPPMTFFIAKGEPDACGRGCGEWIAADGRIDATTPGRLRALLARTGRRRLPIYFFSPGGSVSAAIEIGRLMRAREMTAGVGRTIPQGCDPAKSSEPACDRLKRSGAELAAELRTLNASCNSACVYALLGAKVREVASDAGLGVHRVSVTRTLVRTYSSGRVERSSMALPDGSPGARAVNGQLARYAAEMGISAALIEVATAVPHDRLRFITRDEIARFGIDRRDPVESRWTLHELRPGNWLVVKSVALANAGELGSGAVKSAEPKSGEAKSGAAKSREPKSGEPAQYRTLQLAVACGRTGFVRVALVRKIDPSEALASAAVAWRGSEITLLRGRTQPKNEGEAATQDIWVAAAPKTFVQGAAAGETVDLVETPVAAANAPRRLTLSTLGLSAALDALGRRCQ